MTIDETIQNALTPIVPVVEPGNFLGMEDEYISYTYTEIPIDFGDNGPEAIRYLITIKWYFPRGSANPLQKRRQICRAIAEADMVYPTVTPLDDDVGRCYVFETEAVDGDV